MVLPNHKKYSISITISQRLLNQMNSMIQAGKFSSISDIINVAIAFILGDLSEKRINPNYDYSILVEDIPFDNSAKIRISVSVSEYLNVEIENLAKVTHKNKSFIVRMAVFRFLESYQNIKEVKKPVIAPKEKLMISKDELEEMIHETVSKILKEK
jgi:hypothetical protein